MSRRFAVLDCEDQPKWRGHEALWIDPLARAGERWRAYRVWAGELPEDPAALAGVIITGSHHSVVDGAPWLEALLGFVRAAAGAERGPQIMGCCFGHQALAAALGGDVGLNPDGRFAFGARVIELGDELAADVGGRRLTLLESHEEQVIALPPGARSLAASPGTAHEAFALGRRVLGIQGHPEMEPGHLTERILPGLRDKEVLAPADEAAALASLAEPLDSGIALDLIRRFLDRAGG